mmetsp:Transcript_11150/g.31373  ORF Transcript_11150/g.31373 Transcript_11150/m.31373 type:complete len:594 (+) Transcript_11150:280-2061(+)
MLELRGESRGAEAVRATAARAEADAEADTSRGRSPRPERWRTSSGSSVLSVSTPRATSISALPANEAAARLPPERQLQRPPSSRPATPRPKLRLLTLSGLGLLLSCLCSATLSSAAAASSNSAETMPSLSFSTCLAKPPPDSKPSLPPPGRSGSEMRPRMCTCASSSIRCPSLWSVIQSCSSSAAMAADSLVITAVVSARSSVTRRCWRATRSSPRRAWDLSSCPLNSSLVSTRNASKLLRKPPSIRSCTSRNASCSFSLSSCLPSWRNASRYIRNCDSIASCVSPSCAVKSCLLSRRQASKRTLDCESSRSSSSDLKPPRRDSNLLSNCHASKRASMRDSTRRSSSADARFTQDSSSVRAPAVPATSSRRVSSRACSRASKSTRAEEAAATSRSKPSILRPSTATCCCTRCNAAWPSSCRSPDLRSSAKASSSCEKRDLLLSFSRETPRASSSKRSREERARSSTVRASSSTRSRELWENSSRRSRTLSSEARVSSRAEALAWPLCCCAPSWRAATAAFVRSSSRENPSTKARSFACASVTARISPSDLSATSMAAAASWRATTSSPSMRLGRTWLSRESTCRSTQARSCRP